jgi:DNA mismatch endonuclease, patch repair protein
VAGELTVTARRDPEVTSRIMAHVRDRDSKAELALRRELHARGIRYRLHASDIPGCPDLVIRRLRFAVFVDGDMWHGNEHRRRGLSSLSDMFPSNTEFWVAKITNNMERDKRINEQLQSSGWMVIRLWESDVLAAPNEAADRVTAALEQRRTELNDV